MNFFVYRQFAHHQWCGRAAGLLCTGMAARDASDATAAVLAVGLAFHSVPKDCAFPLPPPPNTTDVKQLKQVTQQTHRIPTHWVLPPFDPSARSPAHAFCTAAQ